MGYSPWGRKESDMTERLHFTLSDKKGASLVAQMVKESSCSAGDLSSIPGSGKIPWVREDPLEKGMVNQSSILA